jgi:hypothetical protein
MHSCCPAVTSVWAHYKQTCCSCYHSSCDHTTTHTVRSLRQQTHWHSWHSTYMSQPSAICAQCTWGFKYTACQFILYGPLTNLIAVTEHGLAQCLLVCLIWMEILKWATDPALYCYWSVHIMLFSSNSLHAQSVATQRTLLKMTYLRQWIAMVKRCNVP